MKKKDKVIFAVAAIVLIGLFAYFFVAFNEPRYVNNNSYSTQQS